MPTLSDLIEQYLNNLVEDAEGRHIEIIRSELASVFDCVPSQINYVLTTRFTPARGFLVESQRGSGGHVRIRRLQLEAQGSLNDLLHAGMGSALTQEEARHICERLLHEKLISERECALMAAAVRRSSLPLPIPLRDQVRATILQAMIVELAQQNSIALATRAVQQTTQAAQAAVTVHTAKDARQAIQQASTRTEIASQSRQDIKASSANKSKTKK